MTVVATVATIVVMRIIENNESPSAADVLLSLIFAELIKESTATGKSFQTLGAELVGGTEIYRVLRSMRAPTPLTWGRFCTRYPVLVPYAVSAMDGRVARIAPTAAGVAVFNALVDLREAVRFHGHKERMLFTQRVTPVASDDVAVAPVASDDVAVAPVASSTRTSKHATSKSQVIGALVYAAVRAEGKPVDVVNAVGVRGTMFYKLIRGQILLRPTSWVLFTTRWPHLESYGTSVKQKRGMPLVEPTAEAYVAFDALVAMGNASLFGGRDGDVVCGARRKASSKPRVVTKVGPTASPVLKAPKPKTVADVREVPQAPATSPVRKNLSVEALQFLVEVARDPKAAKRLIDFEASLRTHGVGLSGALGLALDRGVSSYLGEVVADPKRARRMLDAALAFEEYGTPLIAMLTAVS